MKPVTLVADIPTTMETTFETIQPSTVAQPRPAAHFAAVPTYTDPPADNTGMPPVCENPGETSTSSTLTDPIDLQVSDVHRIYNELRQEAALVEERETREAFPQPMEVDQPDSKANVDIAAFDDFLEDIVSDETEEGDQSQITPEEMDYLSDMLAPKK